MTIHSAVAFQTYVTAEPTPPRLIGNGGCVGFLAPAARAPLPSVGRTIGLSTLQACENWAAVAKMVDAETLVRLISFFGRDGQDCLGLERAREDGDAKLLAGTVRQLLEDWHDGDAAACAFMTAPLELA